MKAEVSPCKMTASYGPSAMFGGWACSCAGIFYVAREDGMQVLLGKDREAWALHVPGIAAMITQGRRMSG